MAAVDAVAPFGVPDAIESEDFAMSSTSEEGTSEDSDADGRRDEDDNCVYLDNASGGWSNTGGLLSSTANDNVGDACQCGDLDLDGKMMLGGNDLPILVDVLLGLNSDPAVADRASVVDGTEANIKDAVFMQLGLDGKLGAFDQVCEDAVLPVQ